MNGKRLPHGGLYAITDGKHENLRQKVRAALQGNARMLQYRDLDSDRATRLQTARELVSLAKPFAVPVIIDHDLELMHACGAAGVHLGATDGDPARVRQILGSDAIIGVSCYGDLDRARAMAARDVDYLSFGAFHASPSKPHARRVPSALLHEATGLGPAIVAIGGISPDNGAALIAAGADFLASISGVFGANDVRAAAQRFDALFDASRASPS